MSEYGWDRIAKGGTGVLLCRSANVITEAGVGAGRSRRRAIVLGAILGVIVAACAEAGASLPPVSTALLPSANPTETAPPSQPAEPVATLLNPAPAELIGRWTADFGGDDVARIDITATGISIFRFAGANLRLEVFGDELVLSHSQLCSGDGRYRWSIDGDKLLFESVTPDPCDGRAKSFDGVTYTRVSS